MMTKQSEMLEVRKIEDKVETTEVMGQGCSDDCAEWVTANPSTSGCRVQFTPNLTILW
ncbi:MAG: hypothetical protein K1W16_03770 [Lachnospiraceae bacterium]